MPQLPIAEFAPRHRHWRLGTLGRLVAPLFLLAGCLTPVGYHTSDGGPSPSGGGGAGGQSGLTGVAGTGGPGGAGVAGTSGHGGSGGAQGGSSGLAGHGAGGTSVPTGIAGTTGGSGTGAAGTSGTSPGTVLYMDNFESDTVGAMANGWLQGDTDTGLGTWAVASDGSNVLQGAATGSDFTVDIGGNVAWTDYTFQVDVKMISGSSWEVGVYGRFAEGTDKANFYEAYMDDSGAVQLRVKQNGSTTTLGTKSKATTAPVLDTVYTFKLDMHGSAITISVNGVVRVMVTDTTLTAGGIGVIVEGGIAEFDNVVVTE
jgi:Domain of Unknown Function (DUF1080)